MGQKDLKTEANDFTDIIGHDGTWQRTIFVVIFFTTFPCSWHTLVMSFLAPNQDYWCAKPPQYENISTEMWTKYGIPPDTSGSQTDVGCKRYEFINFTHIIHQEALNLTTEEIVANGRNQISCQKWEYDDSVYSNTIVTQFDLVCEKSWTVSMANSVFMTGGLVSVLLFGHISDRFGRRPTLIMTVSILFIGGLICAFSTSYVMFAASRFFQALGASGLFVVGFIILMEAAGVSARSAYGVGVEFGWCTAYVLLPLMAWLLKDWFWIQLSITLPCVGLIVVWWLVPESPRWLLTQSKTEEAKAIIYHAAEKNKCNIRDIESALKKLTSNTIKDKPEATANGTVLDLFRTPGLWQKTINLMLCWFVNAFVYFGLSFNTNDLAGDPFVNFAIAGAVEFPAYVMSAIVIKKLGRRIPLMATMVIGGIACLLTVAFTGDLEWVRVPLAMTGKFCITASYAIVYVYTAEIFPTVLRNTGVGTCSVMSRLGSIIAPFVKELGKATHPAVPLACFGGLSVVSGLLIMLLPETTRCKVPDTLQEAADLGRKVKSIMNSKEQDHPMHLSSYGNNEHLTLTDAEYRDGPVTSSEEISCKVQNVNGTQ